jgi:hypothetical protein
MSTINTPINFGVTLGSGGYTSPLSVTNTGSIATAGVAIASPGGGTITNSGLIISTGTYAIAGGFGLSLTNASTGVVSGYNTGVWAAAGTVVNNGTIVETATRGSGVYLANTGPDGTVNNDGLVSAVYLGVEFRGDGSLSNNGTIDSTGRYGVRSIGVATVTNAGSIIGVNGLVLLSGGAVTNTGLITGLNALAMHGDGTVENAGTIDATYGTGVVLSGGTISNAATGLITATGYPAIYVTNSAATITNAGTISGYTGITIASTNTADQTVIDSGTIAGTKGIAIAFGGGDDLLQFNPSTDVSIQGTVDGGGGTNMLTFAAGAQNGTLTGKSAFFANFSQASVATGAQWAVAGDVTFGASVYLAVQGTLDVTGTVTNAGTMSSVNHGISLVGGTLIDSGTISGIAPITFGSGVNQFVVAALATPITGTIAGFIGHDTIDLTSLSDINNDAIVSFDTLTNVLTATGDNGSVQLQLDSENYTGDVWYAKNDGANGTAIIPNCFRAGTAIATPDGETMVERLRPGDLVLTASRAPGAADLSAQAEIRRDDGSGGEETMGARHRDPKPVQWIGYRHIACHRHPAPRKVWPVRINAGAFGDDLPHQDLWLSPDHAVFVDEVLVPIRLLINGTTIQQVQVDEITYYHVELAQHDVILAEGLPAETYLDTGDRSSFSNGGAVVRLFPDFSSHLRDAAFLWETRGCAPMVVSGPALAAVRTRLAGRAAVQTPTC